MVKYLWKPFAQNGVRRDQISNSAKVRAAPFALAKLAVCLVAVALTGACRADDFAEKLFKAGQRAEKAGDKFHAFLLYARAAAIDPANAKYAMRKAALQAAPALQIEERLGMDPAGDPEGWLDSEPLSAGDLLAAIEMRPPPHLQWKPGMKSFDLKGEARTIFEQVAAAFGVVVIFDVGYQAPPPFSFRIADATFEESMRVLEAASNSFLAPVNGRLALVVRDTQQKRTEMSPVMAIAIPIPDRVGVQDAADIMTAVQQTFDIRRIVIDPAKKLIYMRDQVGKIEAARALFAELSRQRAQVEVEVEFFEVTKNNGINWGLGLPNSSSLVALTNKFQRTPFFPSGFNSFLTFGGGASMIGIGVMSANVVANVTKSYAETILKAQTVTLDGQAAQLKVGQRYPIVTTQYLAPPTGPSVTVPPPTVNFEELGLSLKVTPAVHAEGEVSLDLSAEFKVLGAGGANGIPVVSDRRYEGKVRLKEAESAVVAGLVSVTDNVTMKGILGLSSIPWIGKLFGTNSRNVVSTDVLLVLKPHIVASPPWEHVSPAIWVGSESKTLTVF